MIRYMDVSYLILGLITISISIKIFTSFLKKKNKLSLSLFLGFFAGGVGWVLLFVISPTILDIYDEMINYVLIFSWLFMVGFFLFATSVIEVKNSLRVLTVVALFFLVGIHQLFRDLHIWSYIAVVVMLMTSIIFFVIFKRQGDGKSLAVGLALLAILVAEPMRVISDETTFIAGTLVLMAAAIFLMGFLGLFDKKQQS